MGRVREEKGRRKKTQEDQRRERVSRKKIPMFCFGAPEGPPLEMHVRLCIERERERERDRERERERAREREKKREKQPNSVTRPKSRHENNQILS